MVDSMKRFLVLIFICSLPALADDPDSTEFVNINAIDYTIKLDIKYATADNFTKKVVYPEAKCVLRRGAALGLAKAQSALKLQGYGLKVFDCYRPLSIQKKFWELVPDERYVADPKKGSKHNRGVAVDLTLIDSSGRELKMPSKYDDFSEAAHRDSKKMSKVQRKNMQLLEKAMVAAGFEPMPTEWWHFDYHGWENYELADQPLSDFK